MVATNKHNGDLMLQGKFSGMVWASTDMETVAHYYEGCVIELDILLNTRIRQPYIRQMDDFKELGLSYESYTYGSMRVKYPPMAMWYSLSSHYIQSNIRGIREIYPDLSKWQEED